MTQQLPLSNFIFDSVLSSTNRISLCQFVGGCIGLNDGFNIAKFSRFFSIKHLKTLTKRCTSLLLHFLNAFMFFFFFLFFFWLCFFSSAVYIFYVFCHNVLQITDVLKVAAQLKDHSSSFAASPSSQANCCFVSIVFLRRK